MHGKVAGGVFFKKKPGSCGEDSVLDKIKKGRNFDYGQWGSR